MCIISHMFNFGLTRIRVASLISVFGFLIATTVVPAPQLAAQSSASQTADPDPIRLPPVTVNVYKEPEDVQRLPVSVTGVSESELKSAGVTKVSDASIFAPNTFFSEFTERKLSNARFRGISSSPANPGIT